MVIDFGPFFVQTLLGSSPSPRPLFQYIPAWPCVALASEHPPHFMVLGMPACEACWRSITANTTLNAHSPTGGVLVTTTPWCAKNCSRRWALMEQQGLGPAPSALHWSLTRDASLALSCPAEQGGRHSTRIPQKGFGCTCCSWFASEKPHKSLLLASGGDSRHTCHQSASEAATRRPRDIGCMMHVGCVGPPSCPKSQYINAWGREHHKVIVLHRRCMFFTLCLFFTLASAVSDVTVPCFP